MNLLQTLEQEELKKIAAARATPEFRPGDTLRVSVKVVEGERERIQAFEGVYSITAGRTEILNQWTALLEGRLP